MVWRQLRCGVLDKCVSLGVQALDVAGDKWLGLKVTNPRYILRPVWIKEFSWVVTDMDSGPGLCMKRRIIARVTTELVTYGI
jgi:hypothetical protein